MKIILDIATILGGIAAILFFWDRLAIPHYLARFKHNRDNIKSKIVRERTRDSLDRDRVPTTLCCTLAGLLLGLIGIKYGHEGQFIIPLIVCIPLGIINEVLERYDYELAFTVITFSIAFSLFWGFIAAIIGAIIEGLSGQ